MDTGGRNQYDTVDLVSPASTPGSSVDHTGGFDERTDARSTHSRAPLAPGYPPPPPPAMSMPMPETKGGMYDTESRAGSRADLRPKNGRSSSWDLLSGIKNFEAEYEGYDSRKASEAHLAFAEGDLPNTKFAKLYHYLINASVITRWILFIVPLLAILWIPGILSVTVRKNTTIWGVRMIFWSIWLSVIWGGWWACLALSRLGPKIARATLGLVIVGFRRYIDWFDVLQRYVTFFAWSLANWITFQPLILVHNKDDKTLQFIVNVLFALFLCSAILMGEKFAIQWIAGKFHEKSYAERIQAQKFAIQVLTVLYRNSRDIPGRTDTLGGVAREAGKKSISLNPKKFFKRALQNVRFAATTTTTALGNVASEMAGTSVLQPNSPAAVVMTTIHSMNKTRLLARRLFYSFVEGERNVLFPRNIAPYFPNVETANGAFALFDEDGNGDILRDELEDVCIGIHREQLSIEHSMRDLDSAVGRLDNILISLYFFICIIIFAVVLDREVVSLITGAGTLVIGLSWLVGGSLTEVLTAIIFLFIKHPYDVGDRVQLNDTLYTVKEIRLLSTIFLDGNGTSVQAPNAEISSLFILNIRRSGQMSETFPFDVAYDTTFEQLEQLRDQMVAFLESERRDFLPSFDLSVMDIPDQTKMSLKVEIMYKSNWQQPHMRAKRRNKWVCTLKDKLAAVGIYGPGGNPHPEKKPRPHSPERMPTGGWKLNDRADNDPSDVFDEGRERAMTNPRRAPSRMPMPSPAGSAPSPVAPLPTAGTPAGFRSAEEYIEMRTPTAAGFPRVDSPSGLRARHLS